MTRRAAAAVCVIESNPPDPSLMVPVGSDSTGGRGGRLPQAAVRGAEETLQSDQRPL